MNGVVTRIAVRIFNLVLYYPLLYTYIEHKGYFNIKLFTALFYCSILQISVPIFVFDNL